MLARAPSVSRSSPYRSAHAPNHVAPLAVATQLAFAQNQHPHNRTGLLRSQISARVEHVERGDVSVPQKPGTNEWRLHLSVHMPAEPRKNRILTHLGCVAVAEASARMLPAIRLTGNDSRTLRITWFVLSSPPPPFLSPLLLYY